MATQVLDRFVTEFLFRGDMRALMGIEKRVQATAQRLQSASTSVGMVGLGLTGSMVGIAAQGASFERKMSQIVGLVGVSREVVKSWEPEIAAVARATGRAPGGLAEAMFFVTSAGLRGKYAMDLLRNSAKAAAAGLGEEKEIVDLLTSAINAYGKENLTAQQAVDELANAVRLGKLAPDEMASSMGQAFPITSALGISFQETAGMLAAMSRTGTNAATATVQLSQVMNTLLARTTKSQKLLDSMGLSAAQLREEADQIGLFPMLQNLNERLGHDLEKTTTIFGNIRALRAVLDLLGANMADNEMVMREMAKSEGVGDEAFEAYKGTFHFLFGQMKAGMGTAALAVWEQMRAGLERFVRLIKWGAEVIESNPWLAWIIAKVMLLGPLLIVAAMAMQFLATSMFGLLAVGKLWGWWIKVWNTSLWILNLRLKAITLQKWLAVTAGKAWAATTALVNRVLEATKIRLIAVRLWTMLTTAATWLATAASKAWAFALGLVTAHPIIAIITAVAALGVGIVMAIRHWDTLVAAVESGSEKIRRWISNMLPAWARPLVGISGEEQFRLERAQTAQTAAAERESSLFGMLGDRGLENARDAVRGLVELERERDALLVREAAGEEVEDALQRVQDRIARQNDLLATIAASAVDSEAEWLDKLEARRIPLAAERARVQETLDRGLVSEADRETLRARLGSLDESIGDLDREMRQITQSHANAKAWIDDYADSLRAAHTAALEVENAATALATIAAKTAHIEEIHGTAEEARREVLHAVASGDEAWEAEARARIDERYETLNALVQSIPESARTHEMRGAVLEAFHATQAYGRQDDNFAPVRWLRNWQVDRRAAEVSSPTLADLAYREGLGNLPTAGPVGAGAPAAGAASQNISIEIGDIQVTAPPDADALEMAETVRQVVGEETRSAVREAASRIER